ncbi:tRNA (adenosine(37)-N6)-threonylcarbamoyltransferase complex dimerization subunit type 1 TsaB [Halovulum sp. GXIMD14793]
MLPDPLILGFDTSAAHCAAALLSGDRILAEAREDMAKGQAERLMPLLQEVLAGGGADWSDLHALAVGIGPGNFTGIRISVAAARGLALALDIPAIGISTFDTLAQPYEGPVLVSLDARRDRIFVQGPDIEPAMLDWDKTAGLSVPANTLCLGYRVAELADRLGAQPGPDAQVAPACQIARAALPRLNQPTTAPAPLYLRAADAAPPSEQPPAVLHDA